MKIRLLFISSSLGLGGSEKCMCEMINRIDLSKYDVTVLALIPTKNEVEFNEGIKVINGYPFFEELNYSLKQSMKYSFNNHAFGYFLNKLKYRLDVQIGQKHISKYFWKNLSKFIPVFEEKFDVVIGYGQGMATYFCIDKIVNVRKKILWLNTDLVKANYDIGYIKRFYEKADFIVTDSKNGKKNVIELFPKCKDKVEYFPNLLNEKDILEKANESFVLPVKSSNVILTVGRLVEAKAVHLAINAAAILKEQNVDFIWYIVGDGNLFEQLSQLIKEKKLRENVILVGKKLNPYTWFKNCDIYVQTSIYEGSCMTINEAMLFDKPIISTNFPAASEKITHLKNGLICEMTEQSIANSILLLINDKNLKNKIISNVESNRILNENQMEKFYEWL